LHHCVHKDIGFKLRHWHDIGYWRMAWLVRTRFQASLSRSPHSNNLRSRLVSRRSQTEAVPPGLLDERVPPWILGDRWVPPPVKPDDRKRLSARPSCGALVVSGARRW
jgi:hypothetical protein